MARRWWSGALGASACALLLACSPRYDWRTVQSAEGGYSVDYPGKPTAEARPVIIAGQRLPMTMQAASIDGTLFAVGVVELPADDPIWRQRPASPCDPACRSASAAGAPASRRRPA
ncbi:hypothetical protein ACQUWY_19585, partial [Ralstonia pseudosolanacearum]